MSTPAAKSAPATRLTRSLRFALISTAVALTFCLLFTFGAKEHEPYGFLGALVVAAAGLAVCRRWPRMAGLALIIGSLVPLAVLAAFPTEGTRRMLGIVLASVGITISVPLAVSGVVFVVTARRGP